MGERDQKCMCTGVVVPHYVAEEASSDGVVIVADFLRFWKGVEESDFRGDV